MVALQPSVDDDTNTGEDSDNKYGTGRSRYLALKERRSRLARSRSSHLMGNDDEDALDQPVSPTTASPNAYLASRFDDICCEFFKLFALVVLFLLYFSFRTLPVSKVFIISFLFILTTSFGLLIHL